MDPKLIEEIRKAHEASVLLLTLLMEGNETMAADVCYNDDQYKKSATCMTMAVLCASAMRTLALVIDEDPMDIVSSTGLNVAQNLIYLEQREQE